MPSFFIPFCKYYPGVINFENRSFHYRNFVYNENGIVCADSMNRFDIGGFHGCKKT